MHVSGRLIIALFVLTLSVSAPRALDAQGGPPLLTDDPATPGNKHWEINVGLTADRSRAESILETPRIDVNYGLGDHIQLKYEVPWVRLDSNHEQARSGLGNSLLGVKWRFMDEERRGVAVSMYPQLEFNNPTSSARRGLVEQGMQFLLPVEMARRVGPVEVNGEFGYRFIEHRSDEWLYGLALGRQVLPRLELLGEMHGTARRDFGEDQLVFNVGGRFRLDHTLLLLFTGGRSIRDLPSEHTTLIAYVGMQFNF